MAIVVAPAAAVAQDTPTPERLLFLLSYIAVDYGDAVRDGEVIDAFEYAEMQTFGATLVDHFEVLRGRGASTAAEEALQTLQQAIADMVPWADVRSAARELEGQLRSELGLGGTPRRQFDPERAAALYAANCEACHGARGDGDGFAAAWQEPAPSSLAGERMDLLTPRQVRDALTFGIEGTAMPSFEGALDEADRWVLADFAFDLRRRRAAEEWTALSTLVDDAAVLHRRWAAWELGRQRPPAAVRPLLATLGEPDDLLADYAAQALAGYGPEVAPDLFEIAVHDPLARPHAEQALAGIGPALVPELTRRLRDGSGPEQSVAIRVLETLGDQATDALPELLRALGRHAGSADGVRVAAALGSMGRPAVEPLTALLREDRSPRVRELAGRALGFAGEAGAPAVPELLTALEDADQRIRFTAALALGEIGADAAVPALVRRISDDNSASVRRYAVRALEQLAPDPSAVAPALIGCFGDDENVARRAAAALAATGPAALEFVRQALESPDARTRAGAVRTLGRLEGAPREVVPLLIRSFGDESARVRDEAALAMTGLGPRIADPLIEVIGAIGEQDDARVRGYAALVLGKLPAPVARAVPVLTHALQHDPDPTVRRLACWSLGRVGEAAAAAIEPLIALLESDDLVLRRTSVWALGNIGPAAVRALPEIETLAADRDASVREEADEARQKIVGTYTPEAAGAIP